MDIVENEAFKRDSLIIEVLLFKGIRCISSLFFKCSMFVPQVPIFCLRVGVESNHLSEMTIGDSLILFFFQTNDRDVCFTRVNL